MAEAGMKDVFNINVGVLGHVDSGKTSLVAALSDVLSVAALDKHAQSQERGITLDIGLSAFTVPCPEDLQQRFAANRLQFTLVDCPGHASLLKTVLVGAQIIDVMLLVIDATKGIQAQTAECIIVGELLSRCAVVALNKTDLFPPDTAQKSARRAGRTVAEALKLTRFSAAEIVPVAAKAVAAAGEGGEGEGGKGAVGMEELKTALLRAVPALTRETGKPLLFMADHCFAVKGHGTVLSGTVLQGSVARGDTVEIADGGLQRKVKSLQRFREPCSRIAAGDRAGVCVAGVPPAGIERTFLSAPGLLRRAAACVCLVQRCRFYTGAIKSRQKVFITAGYQTCMASVIFLGVPDGEGRSQARLAKAMFMHVGRNAEAAAEFDLKREYLFQDELYGVAGRPINTEDPLNRALVQKEQLETDASGQKAPKMHYGMEWAVLAFDRPLLCLPGSVIISTKFDLDLEHAGSACRIAFYGNVAHIMEDASEQQKLKIFRAERSGLPVLQLKFRKGVIDRVTNDGDAIVKDMFKKDSDLQLFKGNQVIAANGAIGEILGSFGSSGKVRVSFQGQVEKGQVVTMRMKKPVPCKL